jgi:deoxycytidylate deaminase
MPSGWTNECEDKVYVDSPLEESMLYQSKVHVYLDANKKVYELRTKDEVIHAEANAIIKLARDGESGYGSSLFCTHAPCIHCAKLIHGAGISHVYYRESYRDTDGINFLNSCQIEVEKV